MKSDIARLDPTRPYQSDGKGLTCVNKQHSDSGIFTSSQIIEESLK